MPLGLDPDLQEVQRPVGGIVELAVDHPGAGRHALYVPRSHDGPVAMLSFWAISPSRTQEMISMSRWVWAPQSAIGAYAHPSRPHSSPPIALDEALL